ncbi:hypothetical protein RB614_08375 [Phytohabitans sp. ZYX-F-186]|uniref:Uncharacterized protein n=1 Tax=Phytohabitans maris TaxID=3071409 RepID=A0ABU0ZC18_9ACTN|nr:hypothetical protein [Phytohabitans sp. ZYX-F-186]MDQ7904538.1 hypothetical protein [Phytohabitans sp. ZYX-F-186]
MRTGDLLRRLDSRLLPPLARAMSRLAQGRLRMRVLTGVALLSSTAVLLTAVWAADRGEPAGDPTVGEVVRVGVAEGQSIPGYVATSRRELAELVAAPQSTGDTYALVTFTEYLAPERLAPVLREVSVTEVFGRVPLADTQTQIVRIPAARIPGDVVDGMVEVAERKEAEAAEYQSLSGTLTGGSERERQLRQVYDSGAAVAAAEATAYRSSCSCVYAAVIRATPAALERISARSEVRAVDPAPEVRRLDRAVFLPPLPEQEDVVRPPADTALPSPDPSAPPPSTAPVEPAPTSGSARPEPPATSGPPDSPAPTTAEPADTLPPASAPPATEPAASPAAAL